MNDHSHSTIDHPHDLLPGFALGALDANETFGVAAHLDACPGCRDEVDSFRATVCLLPYIAATHEPPQHVKQQLFARIAALESHAHHHAAPPRGPAVAPRAAAPAWSRWAGAVAAASLLLALVLGMVVVNMQSRLDDLTAQLGRSNQPGAVAGAPQQLIAFVSDPATVTRSLDARQNGAHGRMFMQPGHSRAVLMINGLGQMPAGQQYRCWLAKANQPVPVCTVTTTTDGAVEILFDAPAAIDSYEQIMVTIESVEDSAQPSDAVVVEAAIS